MPVFFGEALLDDGLAAQEGVRGPDALLRGGGGGGGREGRGESGEFVSSAAEMEAINVSLFQPLSLLLLTASAPCATSWHAAVWIKGSAKSIDCGCAAGAEGACSALEAVIPFEEK